MPLASTRIIRWSPQRSRPLQDNLPKQETTEDQNNKQALVANTTNMDLRTTCSDVQPLPLLWRRGLVHQVGRQFVNRTARLAIL